MIRNALVFAVIVSCITSGMVHAQSQRDEMPKEDVVHAPAIGEGLWVSNAFQTNMVLQRDQPVIIWGWAKPGEEVTVSFADQQHQTKAAADRSWKVTLEPMPANNTPQRMAIQGEKKKLTLENILVGDVWLLGGQSNMEFPIAKVDDGPLEIASANFPKIRLLTMPQGKGFDSVESFERLHEWSSWSNRHFRKGDWDVCSPETVKEFSAIGYVFGRRLHMATQVPIGLIDASIGGTTVETWTPEAVLNEIEGKETQDKLQEWADKIAEYDAKADLQRRIENYRRRKKQRAEQGNPLPADSEPPSDLRPGPIADRNRPGYCYAGVLRPLEGFAIKGAVFHQGFNNCFDGAAGARMYYQIFGKMITAWRTAFDDSDLPFCIISLCTASEPQTSENYLKPMYDTGVLIREAQYQTFLDFRNAGDEQIGFASSFDFRKSWYHPQIKIPVGERAAKWALVTQYDLLQGDEFWVPPAIEKMERADGTIRLTMSTQIRTKDDSAGKMLGFAIAGQDRRFYPADIEYYSDSVDDRNRPRYQRNVLVLSSPFVDEPVHYRYAWARNPMANLVNPRQVPVATQRSDQWPLKETPIAIPVPPDMDRKSRDRYVRSRMLKELQLNDTERRIKEAEDTLERLKEPYHAERESWEETKAAEAERIRGSKDHSESLK